MPYIHEYKINKSVKKSIVIFHCSILRVHAEVLMSDIFDSIVSKTYMSIRSEIRRISQALFVCEAKQANIKTLMQVAEYRLNMKNCRMYLLLNNIYIAYSHMITCGIWNSVTAVRYEVNRKV